MSEIIAIGAALFWCVVLLLRITGRLHAPRRAVRAQPATRPQRIGGTVAVPAPAAEAAHLPELALAGMTAR